MHSGDNDNNRIIKDAQKELQEQSEYEYVFPVGHFAQNTSLAAAALS